MTNLHVFAGHDAIAAEPVIRKIGPGDIREALAQGADDFRVMRSEERRVGKEC